MVEFSGGAFSFSQIFETSFTFAFTSELDLVRVDFTEK
jgi:hypothetical protein